MFKILGKRSQVKFIVFGLPRSGTTTLTRIFNAHDNLRCLHEPFSGNLNYLMYFQGRQFKQKEIVDELKLKSILGKIFSRFNGIKHLSYQLPPELNRVLLTYPDCKVILMRRKNILQRIISNCISNQAKYWKSNKKKIINTEFKRVGIKWIEGRIAEDMLTTENYRAILKDSGKEYYELNYEDLLGAKLTVDEKLNKLKEIFHYLGVRSVLTPSERRKVEKFLDPAKSKLNSEYTYLKIPNIKEVENAVGSKETGFIFK